MYSREVKETHPFAVRLVPPLPQYSPLAKSNPLAGTAEVFLGACSGLVSYLGAALPPGQGALGDPKGSGLPASITELSSPGNSGTRLTVASPPVPEEAGILFAPWQPDLSLQEATLHPCF